MKTNPLQIRRGTTTATDARVAVAEIRQLIHQDEPQLILFFCAASYELDTLAAELHTAFGRTPVVGCTTAGQLDQTGFAKGGLTAVSLAGDIAAQTFAVDLAATENAGTEIAAATRLTLAAHPERRPFGLLLMDGLSLREEHLASLLYRHLPQVPIVGGSAGDDLAFRQTHVYVDGAFRTHTAVFTLVTTRLAFRPVKFEHFVPTEHALVITRSDPDQRRVYEINGEPAARVYADLIGVTGAALDARTCARNPFVFEWGGEHYVRSIAHPNPDQSLTLFCAIENGVVLSLGRAVDPAATARAAFQRLRDEIGAPTLVIGCDCILRRLEFEQSGLVDTMGEIMKANQVIGFSTYGEQFDGLHVNQTFTGVAIGDDYATV